MTRTAASKARAHKNQIRCIGCGSWVATLVKGRCPQCLIRANACTPLPGGRRCDVHYGLPIYPRRGLCVEGIDRHRREGIALPDLDPPRARSAKPKRTRRRG